MFFGSTLGECEGAELGEVTSALMVLTHSGSDAWRGDWVRIVLDGGRYLQCPLDAELDNLETVTLRCE